MVQKRPFVEELYEVSSKHPRQLEHKSQLVSALEFPCEHLARKPHSSGGKEFPLIRLDRCFSKSIFDLDEKCDSGSFAVLPLSTGEDTANNNPGCISSFSWSTSSASEGDNSSEPPFYPFFPETFSSGRQVRTLHSEELYSYLLEHPPRKSVCIGLEYQADIPEWSAHGAKNSCSYIAEESVPSPQPAERMFSGTCVIPMPEVEPSASNNDKVGHGRSDCCCEDPGSVRCVRQHVVDAREDLRGSLGQESFNEMGFCDMGEAVAEKWSEEDEQLFNEVVCSYPASRGNNFWDHLSVVFPFLSKKEIVSYYFNVFVLRRRAEQNRCDPMNIDSDNDEWQGSDEEGESSEEDEDSVVESPVYQYDHGHNDDDLHEYNNGIPHPTFDCYKNTDFGVPEACPRKSVNKCISDGPIQRSEKILANERGEHELQDDSCASSDSGVVPQVGQVRGTFNGMSGCGSGVGSHHEYVLEPCDGKAWDNGYLTCPRNKVDFLPTCSMIEEVFGAGAWNYKARDDKGSS
ncbi:hypothetical protein RJ640_003289 [Escallonia rubra]|uniref:Myb-like domain-containing protein n=1 Tax=Escallonia rubra TaxID=112253 RepID=A0AA88QJE6_9ASTE|nr:hypothetical protein RJ640_003289 [Escallonia rubra]